MKVKELDGVDFAILMGFAALDMSRRQVASIQEMYLRKLRTENGIEILKLFLSEENENHPTVIFIKKMANVS